MWAVPSGQGKSRIQQWLGFLVLHFKLVDEVIFVFENDHLMERDVAEFQMLFSSLEGAKYCVGLGELKNIVNVGENSAAAAKKSLRRLIVFDEVDVIMFNDIVRFDSLVGQSKCVCFTATPDNKIE